MQLDGALNHMGVSHTRSRKEFETWSKTAQQLCTQLKELRTQLEMVQSQVDKAAGDAKDIRNILLKERSRLGAMEVRMETLR